MSKQQNISIQQNIEEILEKDVRGISIDVLGSIVVEINGGFSLASNLSSGLDAEHIAGLDAEHIAGVVSVFLGSAEVLSKELSQEFKQVYIQSEEKYIILHYINENVALAVITNNKVKIGLIMYWLREKVVPKLERLLK
ncbi:MAG: roadblock/LC7 domain-containing protein [Pseudomonadota bacterium]|nr:roadblock/LC7 domain-containing protein [Pseudomonadota bacterium]